MRRPPILRILAATLLASAATPTHVSVTFEQPLRDTNHPELVYWFITPETFTPGRVAQDIHHIANDTPFTFAFLTERNGVLQLRADSFVMPGLSMSARLKPLTRALA